MTSPSIVAYFTSKLEAQLPECEDAAAYQIEPHGATAAVADGASSSYKAAEWSQELVRSFVRDRPLIDSGLSEFGRWLESTATRFQSRSEESSGSASWYASDASRRGAFATFVGLNMFVSARQSFYQAVQVGDACLFHIREDSLHFAMPGTDPNAFDTIPDLLSSSEYQSSYGYEAARSVTRRIESSDMLLLTSDALGSALLQMHAVGLPVWEVVRRLDPGGFIQAVSDLRAEEVMEDDDVMMLRIRPFGRRR